MMLASTRRAGKGSVALATGALVGRAVLLLTPVMLNNGCRPFVAQEEAVTMSDNAGEAAAQSTEA